MKEALAPTVLRPLSEAPPRSSSSLQPTRRDFLRTSAGLGAALSLAGAPSLAAGPTRGDDRAVILLLLVGGPSQLDTFDPKPEAPAQIRGPFRSIATRLPGVRLGEHLPRLATRLDRLTLVRSLYHNSSPIHETGSQLIQTGEIACMGREVPHFGSVASMVLGERAQVPPFVVLPGPLGKTGVDLSNGQTTAALGSEARCGIEIDGSAATIVGAFASALDTSDEPSSLVEAYGPTSFGRDCLRARRLVEAGSRVVVVNMFTTVFGTNSWDCHGHGAFSTLDDYARSLLPTFDLAFSALLDDLACRGLLESTLVAAAGEFGRTPRLNSSGGRDHWPGVWSGLIAGGDTPCGQVIGASDRHGSAPAERPVSLPEVTASIYRHLRIDPSGPFQDAPGLVSLPDPIRELA